MRDLLRDLFRYLPGVLLPALVGLAEVPILTHLFDPDIYGQYALTITTVLAMTLAQAWITLSIIRLYPSAERSGHLPELYGSSLGGFLGWTALMAGGFLLTLWLLRGLMDRLLLRLMLAGGVLFAVLGFFQVLQHFLRARRRVGTYSAFASWSAMGRLSLGLGLALGFGWGVEGLLWGYILALALVCPILWRAAVGRTGPRLKVRSDMLPQMARYGGPLAVCVVTEWTVGQSNLYFLKVYQGEAAVGVYAASYILAAKGILLFSALFQAASRPLEMHIWEKEGQARSQSHAARITRLYLLVVPPFGVLMACLARPAIGILTGAEYLQGYVIVPLIVLGSLMLGLEQRYQVGLLLHKKTGLLMLCFLASAASNLLLNRLLVPRWSYIGAASASAASYALLLGLTVALAHRHFRFPFPLATLGRTAVALAVAAAGVWSSGFWLGGRPLTRILVAAPAGLMIYAAVLAALREFRAEEWNAMRRLLRNRGGSRMPFSEE